MSGPTLLQIALDCAGRGWYVFPCIPKTKQPATKTGFKEATLDPAKIREWWGKNPQFNVGIACGASDLCVVDCDYGLDGSAERLADFTKRLGLDITYTVRTGRRPGFGLQLYLSGAIPDSKFEVHTELASYTGDVKSQGGYVMAAGSIHPSGEAYGLVSDTKLQATPEAVRALKRAQPAVTLGDDIIESDRNSKLTQIAGKLRSAGMSAETLREVLHAENERRCTVPLPADEVDKIADSASKWSLPEQDVAVSIGPGKRAPDTEDADMPEGSTRPAYPDHVWEGTAYGEFAELCTRDNYIPRKMFSESFRTVVGALVGDRLRCTLTGVTPRSFTIKIAAPGSGKGTSDEYVRRFFCVEQWEGLTRTEAPLLWDDPSEVWWRSRGIGAQSVSPASAPGLIKAIEARRLKKGETLDSMEAWKPMPRVITMSEEVRGLFANFANESTGAGLESVLCELFDRDSFTSTATKDRGPASGKLMYSLLGGITREGWDSVFSKVESVESGFLSRVSIIGTEEVRTTAGLRAPDFTDLQNRFLPWLQRLESEPVTLDADDAALRCMNEWFGGLRLAEGVNGALLNIHAWRTALHLAWLHERASITEEDVRSGIAVAEYQAKMREFYAPPQGETRSARCEASIRKVITTKRRVTVRELRRATHGSRWGIGLWDGSLQALVKAGEIRLEDAAKGGKTAILLKVPV